MKKAIEDYTLVKKRPDFRCKYAPKRESITSSIPIAIIKPKKTRPHDKLEIIQNTNKMYEQINKI
jgi:hypothetical protein